MHINNRTVGSMYIYMKRNRKEKKSREREREYLFSTIRYMFCFLGRSDFSNIYIYMPSFHPSPSPQPKGYMLVIILKFYLIILSTKPNFIKEETNEKNILYIIFLSQLFKLLSSNFSSYI